MKLTYVISNAVYIKHIANMLQYLNAIFFSKLNVFHDNTNYIKQFVFW